jgi:phosphoribosylamine--glycine ligase
MGDPEAESVLPRIENDLLELFVAISRGKLSDENILITSQHVSTVMLVSQGYPDKYEKGKIISLPDEMKEAIIFHAGTSLDQFSGNILTSGGRVLAVTAFGNDMKDALKKSYTGAEIIRFDGKYFRRDIGFDL